MKVLVTGGAGFIGSHTCLALAEKGYEVVVVDSCVNGNKKSIEGVVKILKVNNGNENVNIEVIKADIRDEKLLNKIFSDHQNSGKPLEAVIHFAGLKSVKNSVSNPLEYWDVNLIGSINLLKVMDKFECNTIVFSSSATIYGGSNKIPIKENTEIKPINPYGRTKSAIEQVLGDVYFSNPSKWRIANLRYFNPIGAHPSGLIGESPIGVPNNIFPFITQVAAGNLQRLTIFGNDWPTPDGTGVRDYIHVMDLAEGHIHTLEHLLKRENQIISLNIGTGIGTSVLELVNIFQLVNKINVPYEISQRRKGDAGSVIADNNLAISYLNWSPKRSIEDMCSDGWKWQVLNPKGYL
tara:strand:+ start:1977 stop:3029 length:1053 start_codon:yes stop_codon:yes gene_type:complete